jgi:hypothetical protein
MNYSSLNGAKNKNYTYMNKVKNIKRNNRRIKQTLRTQTRKNKKNTKQIKKLKRQVNRIHKNIPNAYIRNYRNKYFKITKTTQDTMIVSGRDLVYKLPDTKLEQEMRNVLTVIPANPAYWQGTGIASMAVAYQQFRPMKFHVHYIPIVDTSRSGTIFAGTIWNTAINDDGFEQTLTRTPGAINTQFFKPATGRVKVKGFMNNKLFNVAGELNEDSNPFFYVAVCTGSFDGKLDPPGMFYVTYQYIFKNPIGNNSTFRTPALINFRDVEYKMNTTALLCKSTTITKRVGNTENFFRVKVPLFAQLQIDWSELGAPVASYNGDPIPLNEDDRVWVFQNWINDIEIESNPLPVQYRLTFSERAQASAQQPNTVQVTQGSSVVYATNDQTNELVFFIARRGNYDINLADIRTDSENNAMIYNVKPEEINQLSDLKIYYAEMGWNYILKFKSSKENGVIYLNDVPISFDDDDHDDD